VQDPLGSGTEAHHWAWFTCIAYLLRRRPVGFADIVNCSLYAPSGVGSHFPRGASQLRKPCFLCTFLESIVSRVMAHGLLLLSWFLFDGM
jgi:hypothetical protein